MSVLTVGLGERSYPITIESGSFGRIAASLAEKYQARVMLVWSLKPQTRAISVASSPRPICEVSRSSRFPPPCLPR